MWIARRRSVIASLGALIVASSLAGISAQAAVSATEPAWTSAQKAGGTGSDDGNAITMTGTGAPVVAGNFSGTAYFPKSAVADDSWALSTRDDSQDIFVAAMNPAGTYFTWAQTAGGPGESVTESVAALGTKTATTTDDTILVTGWFKGTMYFPKSATPDDSVPLIASGAQDMFIAALRPGGSYFGWAQQVSPGSGSDVAAGMSIAVGGDDTPMVVGYFTSSASFPTGGTPVSLTASGQGMFVAALRASTGTFAWAQSAGGSAGGGVMGDSVAITGRSSPSGADDTPVITGTLNPGTNYFPTGRPAPDDSIALTVSGLSVFVAAMNADDSYFAWAQSAGGGMLTGSGSIAISGDDTPVIVGYFTDTAYFPTGRPAPDDSFAVTSSPASQDVFIAALAPRSRYFAWVQKAGGSGEDVGLGIATMSNGTPVITGRFTGSAAFPTASGAVTLTSAAGATSAFVAALDRQGSNFAWAQMAGGSSGNSLMGLGVVTSGDDTSIIVGNLSGTASFEQSSGSLALQSTGSKDAFVARIVLGTPTPAPDPVPPAPAPVYPASAPTGVTAAAGDASAKVTWSAPASTGSFPVTSYQATATPGGQSCLVAAPALTCEVTGLTNGTTYTFKVRALNGAGWSAESEHSNAVTPKGVDPPPVDKTITITGSRSGTKIVITGSSTGIDPGSVLKPWLRFPGQSTFVEGVASIPVQEKGAFTWERRAGKKAYVYIQTADGKVKSNTVTIAAR